MNYPTSPDKLESKLPSGSLPDMWSNFCASAKLVAPSNRSKFRIIVVGTGLAGASAAASLGEQGYQVTSFCLQDSPRRAHSVAAQGGINASKDYANDGDSDFRLFWDTIRGGDFRAREANVYRLAQLSGRIVDHCVAQGVPFAREYGGLLSTRSFGGALLSRTFYARGQTGQQLLLGAYASLMRQVSLGTVTIKTRSDVLDIVVENQRACGVVYRNLVTGQLDCCRADAVVLASGGYSSVFFLSTNALSSNVRAAFRAYRRGAYFANPCFTQIHPTCIPQGLPTQCKLVLMSESLRNDGRVWVPSLAGDKRRPQDIPEDQRDYFLERLYPAYGNLVPRDIASRAVWRICEQGGGVGQNGQAVFLDMARAIEHLGLPTVLRRYGNLFKMYKEITAEDPCQVPLRIFPAPHYTMGGLWVDYSLMTNISGLFAIGEANFSDHGSNRLGASALLQGLADGYFILPHTLGNYLAQNGACQVDIQAGCFTEVKKSVAEEISRVLAIGGKVTVRQLWSQLGNVLRTKVGLIRSAQSLQEASTEIEELKECFWRDLKVAGRSDELNNNLELALRLEDYLDLAKLLVLDAWHRQESCGGHFRLEHQTNDGEAKRDDDNFAYVAAWESTGQGNGPVLHKEALRFSSIELAQRNYR